MDEARFTAGPRNQHRGRNERNHNQGKEHPTQIKQLLKNDFAAFGMRPFSSNGSLGSMAQTDAAYHKVSPPETNAHRSGRPDSPKTRDGAQEEEKNAIDLGLKRCVWPFTSFIMGMLTLPYSPDRYSAKAQKCGGVQEKSGKQHPRHG